MVERYGDYELMQQIATGGMAEIHLARQQGFAGDRLVIIKRMLPQLTVRPEFVQMFLDEARLTANLQHQNIARVHDLGENAGSYFIAMELVDGPHLGALFANSLRARKPLPLDLCVWICARAADGLHYAHEMHDPATGQPLHLVHRDISPQNILVSREGEVKVTDFGVAKSETQQTKTRTGIIKGKVAYMSPEQCLGEKLDHRSDVFALGIVLYELLTRRRLFRDKSDLLIMQKITGEDVAPPSTVNPQVDARLDAILAKALARSVADRYASADEFAVALDAWVGGRASERSLATWFAHNCPELAPSSTLPPDALSSGAPARDVTTVAPFSDLSGARAHPAAPKMSLVDVTANADADADAAIAQLAQGRRRRVGVAAGAAAAAVVALIGFIVVSGSDPPTDLPVVPPKDAVAATAKLRVTTTPPGVSIIVGDRVLGQSPVEIDVPVGPAKVQAQFADQPARTVDVVVEAGRVNEVALQARVPMSVRSTPPRAKVKIDGVARGETPWDQNFLVEPGVAVTLRLEAPGMQPYEAPVTAQAGQPLRVDVKLEPEPKSAVPKRPETDGFGSIKIGSEPWAVAKLGGEVLGETPVPERKVKAGRQILTVTNPKFNISESFPVTITKGKTTVVLLRFADDGRCEQKTVR
jgi:serine/threonine protein kinase